jgi:hypothetical protein
MRRCWAVLAFCLLGMAAAAARGEVGLHEGLPEDTLGFVELDPGIPESRNEPGQNALLDMGLEAMQSFGVLPKEAGLVGDAMGLASVAGNHRNCVALLDADLAVVGNGGLACKSVQVAWVVETNGQARDAGDLVQRLTHLLDNLSTQETARQAVKKTAEGKREYVEFHDTRWPAWLTLAWTQHDNVFVITLGAGAMEHYLSDRAVGGPPWKETVLAADAEAARLGERAATGRVMARMYVTAKAFRERYPEAMNKTVLGRIFASVDLRTADAALFSARTKDRNISLDRALVTAGQMRLAPWTEELPADSPLAKAVPAEATAYLALHMDWEKLYERVTAICDAVLTSKGDEPIDKQVTEFARRQGVDVRRDILRRLSPIVLVHDWPEHPLKLPFMVTALGGADPASKDAIRKLLNAASAELEAKLTKKKARGHFRLRTDKDGVMYMQFGLVGPAWAWSENRWVFSWSPAAVRYNLPMVKGVGADAFGPR